MPENSGSPDGFPLTRWSIVQRAALSGEHGAFAALSELCETYYDPILAVVRSRRNGAGDAEDLTQHFFLHLIEKGNFSVAARKGIKLRSFLLQELKGFLIGRHRHSTAAKRDGRGDIHLESPEAQAGFLEAADWASPDLEYDRRWRMTLVSTSMKSLGRWWERRRKANPSLPAFEDIAPLIGQTSGESLPAAAQRLGMNPNTLKSHVRSVRQELGAIIRQNVAQTLVHPTEEAIREELGALKLIG